MSSGKGLSSLTPCYTDSENEDGDNRDESSMELETEEDEKEPEEDDDDLPPEPTGRCPQEIQDKVTSLYYKIQNEGLDMNKEIQSRKSFRNPSIYEKLIDFCNLNELGTNYPAEIYDPFRWGKESYYDELNKIQKAEMDKRDKEKKEKTKVEIVSGAAKKTTTNGSISNNTTTTTLTTTVIVPSVEGGEKRRKTKWDLH